MKLESDVKGEAWIRTLENGVEGGGAVGGCCLIRIRFSDSEDRRALTFTYATYVLFYYYYYY